MPGDGSQALVFSKERHMTPLCSKEQTEQKGQTSLQGTTPFFLFCLIQKNHFLLLPRGTSSPLLGNSVPLTEEGFPGLLNKPFNPEIIRKIVQSPYIQTK